MIMNNLDAKVRFSSKTQIRLLNTLTNLSHMEEMVVFSLVGIYEIVLTKKDSIPLNDEVSFGNDRRTNLGYVLWTSFGVCFFL